MTGTADTEAAEMKEIYGLDVVIIPTHRPMIRNDQNDLIYLNREGKYNAIIQEIQRVHEAGVAPILIGTATIEASEILSDKLKEAGIEHEVLNAKQHEREADIIAQAGAPRAVTIATNMAGRGTDILLGGNWKALLAKIENPTPEDEARLKQNGKRIMKQFWLLAVCILSVLSVMNLAVSITSCVVVQAVRVTRVYRVSTCLLKMT